VTTNVNLTPELEEMVRQKVASALYTSAAEVIREALRLLEKQDRIRAAKLDQLRQEIQDELNNGPATTWDAREIRREGAKKRAARARESQRKMLIWQAEKY